MKIIVRSGQTALEYVLTFSILILAVSAFAYLLKATKSAVVRTERHVSSEYP